jgi:hypothetical protein
LKILSADYEILAVKWKRPGTVIRVVRIARGLIVLPTIAMPLQHTDISPRAFYDFSCEEVQLV